jgi:hypothetical protein
MLRHTIKPERISGYCKRRQGDGEPCGSGPGQARSPSATMWSGRRSLVPYMK